MSKPKNQHKGILIVAATMSLIAICLSFVILSGCLINRSSLLGLNDSFLTVNSKDIYSESYAIANDTAPKNSTPYLFLIYIGHGHIIMYFNYFNSTASSYYRTSIFYYINDTDTPIIEAQRSSDPKEPVESWTIDNSEAAQIVLEDDTHKKAFEGHGITSMQLYTINNRTFWKVSTFYFTEMFDNSEETYSVLVDANTGEVTPLEGDVDSIYQFPGCFITSFPFLTFVLVFFTGTRLHVLTTRK